MERETIFRILTALIFLATYLTRKIYERRSEQIGRTGLVQDKDDKRMIVLQSLLLTISLVALLVYIIKPGWMQWASLPFPLWLRWLGFTFGALGAILLIWSHISLDDNFFGGVKIRAGHTMITRGPYRWVRHPMYTAFVILGLAFILLPANWMTGAAWLAGSLLTIMTRLKREENMMIEQFGNEYREYIKKTSRFFPGL